MCEEDTFLLFKLHIKQISWHLPFLYHFIEKCCHRRRKFPILGIMWYNKAISGSANDMKKKFSLKKFLSRRLAGRGQGLKRYSNYFPNGIYGLKFECTATATGSRNMGRLSIDDIVLGMKTGSNENNYYITNYGKTAA